MDAINFEKAIETVLVGYGYCRHNGSWILRDEVVINLNIDVVASTVVFDGHLRRNGKYFDFITDRIHTAPLNNLSAVDNLFISVINQFYINAIHGELPSRVAMDNSNVNRLYTSLYDEQYPQNKDAVVARSAEDIAEAAPHDGNTLFTSNEHGFFIKKDYILPSSIGIYFPLGEVAQSLLDDHKKKQESLYAEAVDRAKRRVDIEEEVAKTQMSSLGYTPHSRAVDGSVITYTSLEYKADVRVYKTADGALNATVYNVLDRSIIKTSIDSISFPHPRLVDFIKQLDKLSELWDDQ